MKLRWLITKASHPIMRRRFKRAGLLAWVLCLLLLLASSWSMVGFSASIARRDFAIVAESGSLSLTLRVNDESMPSETLFGPLLHWHGAFDIDTDYRLRLDSWMWYSSFWDQYTLRFPLSLPLLLIGVVTGRLWLVDKRASRYECDRCYYDLRGLEGRGEGIICPECGLAIGEG